MVLLVAAAGALVMVLIAVWAAVADGGLRLALAAAAAMVLVVALGLAIGLRGVVDTGSTTGADRRVEAAPEEPSGDGRPRYDGTRTAIGLAVAAACLLAALGLWRRTDWTAVGGDPFAGVDVPSDPFGERDVPSSRP